MCSATVSSSLPRRYVYRYCGGAVVTGSVLLGCPAPRPVAGRTRPSTTCAVGLGSASLTSAHSQPDSARLRRSLGRAAAAVYVFRPLDIAAVLSLRAPSSWAVLPAACGRSHTTVHNVLSGWEAPPCVGTFPARQRPVCVATLGRAAAAVYEFRPLPPALFRVSDYLPEPTVYHKLCPVGQFLWGRGCSPYTPCFDVYGGLRPVAAAAGAHKKKGAFRGSLFLILRLVYF